METILDVRSISKAFGEVNVFADLSFRVARGEFVTLLGPSGCGKSTILNILSGLLNPDGGKVSLRGEDITGETGHVSYMQQKDLLFPWRRIIDNIALPLQIQGTRLKQARKKVKPLLVEFGLKGFENRYPFQLSGGMRQRAALLRTYLFSKEVLLLDEPFAKLDEITKRKLHSWFIDVLEHLESTVFFVTHDIDEALKLSDRIYVLSQRPARVMKVVDAGGRGRRGVKQEIIQLLEEGERMPITEPFDRYADKYEEWFSTFKTVYDTEVEAIRGIMPKTGTDGTKEPKGLEIGAGSGLFAARLGVKYGVEPSHAMLEKSLKRGIKMKYGVAEALPYMDESFDYTLMVTAVCFLDSLDAALDEIHRVLKPGGWAIFGFVDKDSPLGKTYREHKEEDVFYKQASFRSAEELIYCLEEKGFQIEYVGQTIFGGLDEINEIQEMREGHGEGGFVVLKAGKPKV